MTTLRIAGVPEHFNLPWQLGLERRAFLRAGIDLQWRTVPEGTGAMCDLLRAGEVDLAVLVTEGAVRDIVNGNPSRIVSNYVDTPLTWGVHVSAKSDLRTPKDLKHLPFAISRFNSGSHLMAMNYAEQCGWQPAEKDFIIVNDLQGALDRMASGEPMVFLWELSTTAHWVEQGVLRRVDTVRPAWPCFMVVARNEVLASSADVVRRLLRVLHDQARGLMEKKNVADTIAQRYSMSVNTAAEWFTSVRWNTTGTVNMQALQAVSERLHRVGAIDHALTPEELAAMVVQVMPVRSA
jgi:sulfonate transport system substrate-binding protein